MNQEQKQSAELIVLPPKGELRSEASEFIAQCVIDGVDFYFEQDDKIPQRLPSEVEGVRAIVIDQCDVEANAKILNSYKEKGVYIYIMDARSDPLMPNGIYSWKSIQVLNTLLFDANITYHNDIFTEKMNARDEKTLFDQLGERMLATSDIRWYDAMRYNWEGLVDGYEQTGNKRYLDTVYEQMIKAMGIPNTLWNCDCVAPLIPMLRVFEITKEKIFINYAREKFNAYISQTPKYDGCFVNFNTLVNHVRSEIIWQVCPGLMMLSHVTGDTTYSDVAMDQFVRMNVLLSDPQTGFWFHGRNSEVNAPAFWARGEAFVFLGLLMILENCETSDPRCKNLLSAFVRLANSLRSFQHSSGFWYSVINEPSSEFESSGTAWITAAAERGMRLGYLDSRFTDMAQKGWRAVKSRIWQGGYPGHSVGTTVSKSYSYYLKRILNVNGWTHFAFRAACERMRSRGMCT